jgi:hypothetical protein
MDGAGAAAQARGPTQGAGMSNRYFTFILYASNIDAMEDAGVSEYLHESARGCKLWRTLTKEQLRGRWVVVVTEAQREHLLRACCNLPPQAAAPLDRFVGKLIRLGSRA